MPCLEWASCRVPREWFKKTRFIHLPATADFN
jgi:hypothetical protein